MVRSDCRRIFALWRVLHKLAIPNGGEAGPTVVGSRRLMRQLVHHGVARVERSTLQERATVASAAVMESLSWTRGSQLVLWFDNLYWQRFGTDPVGSDLSQNVTAMAVLVLDEI